MQRDITIDLNGHEYAAIDFGGEGRDVLLVHQLASNAQVWGLLAPRLAEFCHPVAIDLRGHGRSLPGVPDATSITRDLPEIAAALGMTRPLVLLEHEEILAITPDRLAGLDACGIASLSVQSTKRGQQARDEWAETIGEEALAVWVERFRLFATGTADEREPYLADILARTEHDWLTSEVPQEQLRAYYERHLRDTPTGWERLPVRDALEPALRFVESQPHGLDLLDTYPGPLWLLAPDEAVDDDEVDELEAYIAARDGGPERALRIVPGGPAIDTIDLDVTAACVKEMLDHLS